MSCEGEGEGEEEEGKLPSVDHGRRTDRGRDKNQNGTINHVSRAIKISRKLLNF